MTYAANDRDRAQVKALSGFGIPQEQIAQLIGVSKPTLRKYYLQEISAGMVMANAKVAESLFRQATDQHKPNVVAAIFWLKCRAGWTEPGKGNELGKKEQRNNEAREVASRFAVHRGLRAVK